jgi:alpha-L-rhamnosidase
MDKRSYWIWKYGDYEIFHSMQVHMRRVEREVVYPPYWKMYSPDPKVMFYCEYEGDGGYVKVYTNGEGYVKIGNQLYNPGARIELPKGKCTIVACIGKADGLPAIFAESDVIPSGSGWFVKENNHSEKIPVGYDEYYDSADKDPEIFHFEYKKMLPVASCAIEGGMLYDFGIETFGFLDISGALPEKELGVYYGESREEAIDTDHTYTFERISGKGDYRLVPRAFRYIFIKGGTESLSISADYEYLPVKEKGSFRCDNELFNKIWDVCAYTFHLNCREGFLDGIKRDRWIWGGDAYQCNHINNYLFFDPAIEQRTNLALIGKDPVDHHINGIVDYSFLYVIGLYEHYFTHGDKEFLKRIYSKAVSLMKFCETRLNPDGFIEGAKADWTFIDWSDIDKSGAVAAEQMLCIKAYEALGKIAAVVGENGAEWLKKSAEMKQKIDKFFWDTEKGAYIDSYSSSRRNVTRHANIFAIMFGIATEEQTDSIIKNVIKNDAITKITTPYFEGYELDVLAKLGDFKFIEDMLDSYWGGMIRLGATTIWEGYDPTQSGARHYQMYWQRYDKSLCHAWGSTPIYLFGRYYLGVYPTSPAYETFSIEPHLGGLGEIEGTVPICGGEVSVKMDKTSLSVTATKDGGTLVFGGRSYALTAYNTLKIEY